MLSVSPGDWKDGSANNINENPWQGENEFDFELG